MYCSRHDLELRFGEDEVASLLQGRGVDEEATLALVFQDVTAEINSYLAARYQLPLVVVSDVLVRIACDLARYYLYSHAAHEQVQARYNSALKLLKNISTGVVSLGVPASDDSEVVGVPTIETGRSPFSRECR